MKETSLTRISSSVATTSLFKICKILATSCETHILISTYSEASMILCGQEEKLLKTEKSLAVPTHFESEKDDKADMSWNQHTTAQRN